MTDYTHRRALLGWPWLCYSCGMESTLNATFHFRRVSLENKNKKHWDRWCGEDGGVEDTTGLPVSMET